MKSHLLTLAAAVLAIFAFSSCKKDPGYGDPAVKVNPGELNFKVDGGSETVNLTATVEWTVENSASWVKVEPMAGDPSKELQPVKVTVSKNKGVERTATVTFKQTDGALTAKLTINQEAYIPEVQTIDVSSMSKLANIYKYQRFQLTGVVKSLKSDGSFNLVDGTGSVQVAGLSASEVAYGTQGGKLDNVKERGTVTIIGYYEGGKFVYAYLVKYEEYSEPSPDTAGTKSFPYTADYKTAENGVIVNNQIFPLAFDALWSWSASTGWQASGNKNDVDYTTEATLYTEKVDLKNAEKPILVFEHMVGRTFADMDVAKEQTSVWVRKEGGEWNKLAITFSYPDELGEQTVSVDIKLDAYIGSVVQFAFKYTSEEGKSAGIWQILKIEVKKNEEPTQPDNSTGTEDYDKPGWDWNK